MFLAIGHCAKTAKAENATWANACEVHLLCAVNLMLVTALTFTVKIANDLSIR
jgi:hypothetical protein